MMDGYINKVLVTLNLYSIINCILYLPLMTLKSVISEHIIDMHSHSFKLLKYGTGSFNKSQIIFYSSVFWYSEMATNYEVRDIGLFQHILYGRIYFQRSRQFNYNNIVNHLNLMSKGGTNPLNDTFYGCCLNSFKTCIFQIFVLWFLL